MNSGSLKRRKHPRSLNWQFLNKKQSQEVKNVSKFKDLRSEKIDYVLRRSQYLNETRVNTEDIEMSFEQRMSGYFRDLSNVSYPKSVAVSPEQTLRNDQGEKSALASVYGSKEFNLIANSNPSSLK